VEDVRLQPERSTIAIQDFPAEGPVRGPRRSDPFALEIDPIDNVLAVLTGQKCSIDRRVELSGKPAVVLSAGGDPDARCNLRPHPSPDGMPLVLRDRERLGRV